MTPANWIYDEVPEAFTFNGQEITGYWIMKYTVGK